MRKNIAENHFEIPQCAKKQAKTILWNNPCCWDHKQILVDIQNPVDQGFENLLDDVNSGSSYPSTGLKHIYDEISQARQEGEHITKDCTAMPKAILT